MCSSYKRYKFDHVHRGRSAKSVFKGTKYVLCAPAGSCNVVFGGCAIIRMFTVQTPIMQSLPEVKPRNDYSADFCSLYPGHFMSIVTSQNTDSTI